MTVFQFKKPSHIITRCEDTNTRKTFAAQNMSLESGQDHLWLDNPHLSRHIPKRDSKSFTLCRPESGINDSARNAANRSELSKSDNVLPGTTFSLDGNRKCCHIMIKVSQMRSSLILQQMLSKDCLILTCVLAAIPLLEWKASKAIKWHREGLFPFSFKTSGNSFRILQIVFPHFSSYPEQTVMHAHDPVLRGDNSLPPSGSTGLFRSGEKS